jgi:hypothetical protein
MKTFSRIVSYPIFYLKKKRIHFAKNETEKLVRETKAARLIINTAIEFHEVLMGINSTAKVFYLEQIICIYDIMKCLQAKKGQLMKSNFVMRWQADKQHLAHMCRKKKKKLEKNSED